MRFFFSDFPLDYYEISSSPCAMQYVLVDYLFYIVGAYVYHSVLITYEFICQQKQTHRHRKQIYDAKGEGCAVLCCT